MADAADLLKTARRSAGMTQQELGRKAGVTQSVVSAYENGRREPALSTLVKLINATGQGLDVSSSPPITRESAEFRLLIESHREELITTLTSLGARRIQIFGSVARGDASSSSDVDILVELDPEVGLFTLARMHREAERILGVDVDIVPEDSLKGRVRSDLASDLVAL